MEISNRSLPEYEKGVIDFLKFAFTENAEKECCCPCRKSKKTTYFWMEIFEHLMVNGIERDYKRWFHHGEKIYESEEESDKEMHVHCNVEVQETVHEFGQANVNFTDMFESPVGEDECGRPDGSKIIEEANKYYRLLEEANEEFYPGSGISKLSFVLKLLNLKCLFDLSGEAMDAIFEIILMFYQKELNHPSHTMNLGNYFMI